MSHPAKVRQQLPDQWKSLFSGHLCEAPCVNQVHSPYGLRPERESVLIATEGGWRLSSALLLVYPMGEYSIPSGTLLSIRLKTEISSKSPPGTPLESVLIAPIRDGRCQLVPAGPLLAGIVLESATKSAPNGSALLDIRFHQLEENGNTTQIKTKVATVDNARETVDQQGRIRGLPPLRARPGKIEDVLLLAAHAHPAVLGTIVFGKYVLGRAQEPGIHYKPGIEMDLALIEPVPVKSPWSQPLWPELIPYSQDLEAFVAAQPLRTTAEKPPQPSDITNLMFLSSEDRLYSAFTEAGWNPATATNLKSEVLTFLAVADRHAYHEGPVSILLLEGRKPDLIFQKQNNTFSKRHHVRIWRRSVMFRGKPVWVGAATHDIGIVFSREARTFSHKVDPNVDKERSKIVDDLCFTGQVEALALIERAGAAGPFWNATGDSLATDGAMAIVQL